MGTNKFQQFEIQSGAGLRAWLENHYKQGDSIWLVTFKKSVRDKYVSVEEVLDELICFGWIDGRRMKLDDDRTMQLISPRRAQHWAKTYKDRAARLIKEGKMHKAGLQSIERSKREGLWDFMDDVDQLIIPTDLRQALDSNTEATEFFEAINPSSKRNILRWIKLAKTPDTRAKRIAKTVFLASKGEKVPGM